MEADFEQEFALQPSKGLFQPKFLYNSLNLKHNSKKVTLPVLTLCLFLYCYSKNTSEKGKIAGVFKNQLGSSLSESPIFIHIDDIKPVYTEEV